jgi:DNA polymerase-3 subunit epsilon
MKVLAFDTETTGLDPAKDRIIEMGWALWDTERAAPLLIRSFLVDHGGLTIPPEITRLTGITEEDLATFGSPVKEVLDSLGWAWETFGVDRWLAHNAPFDRAFLEALLGSSEAEHIHRECLSGHKWIDTLTDLPTPEHAVGGSLLAMSAEHGFINPFRHRAVFDALSAALLLQRYPLDEVLKRSDSPAVTVHAIVSFDDNQKAKDLRFRWEPSTKRWLKTLKECDLAALMEKAQASKMNVRLVA